MHNVMQQSNLYRAEVTKYSQFRKMEGNMAHVSELGFDFMNVIEKFQIKFTSYKIKLTTFVFTFVAAVAWARAWMFGATKRPKDAAHRRVALRHPAVPGRVATMDLKDMILKIWDRWRNKWILKMSRRLTWSNRSHLWRSLRA